MYLKHIKADLQLYTYLEKIDKLQKKELYDLEERGFLINLNKNAQDYFADQWILTDKFSRLIDPEPLEAEQFWATYPGFALINGKRQTLKGIDKDDFLAEYTRKVSRVKGLHDRIMKALRYQKGMDEINIRIDKWFNAKTWESVEQAQQELRKEVYGQREL